MCGAGSLLYSDISHIVCDEINAASCQIIWTMTHATHCTIIKTNSIILGSDLSGTLLLLLLVILWVFFYNFHLNVLYFSLFYINKSNIILNVLFF